VPLAGKIFIEKEKEFLQVVFPERTDLLPEIVTVKNYLISVILLQICFYILILVHRKRKINIQSVPRAPEI
jgi:hypothetical protein